MFNASFEVIEVINLWINIINIAILWFITFMMSATIMIFLWLFYLVYSIEKKFGIQKIPINENFRRIIFDNARYLPIKWFDWLKWIIIIGGISIIEKDTSSILLTTVITFSYIAFAFDLYRTSYDLMIQIFVINIFYFIESLDKELEKSASDDLKKNVNALELELGVLGLYLHPLEYTEKYKELIIEGRRQIEVSKELDLKTKDARIHLRSIKKIVKLGCFFIAITWTSIVYALILHIISLYTR